MSGFAPLHPHEVIRSNNFLIYIIYKVIITSNYLIPVAISKCQVSYREKADIIKSSEKYGVILVSGFSLGHFFKKLHSWYCCVRSYKEKYLTFHSLNVRSYKEKYLTLLIPYAFFQQITEPIFIWSVPP